VLANAGEEKAENMQALYRFITLLLQFLKGHGFSRAGSALMKLALATEGFRCASFLRG
jgi:hypothetical protein